MYHQPLDTCIEFCTARDAGLLLANACEDDVPESFWRNFYNIGGGPAARVTFVEMMGHIFTALGLGTPEHLSDRNWYALRNFHCHWYEDSSRLNDYLHFQTMGMDEYAQSIVDGSPWYVTLPTRPGINWLMRRNWVKGRSRRLLLNPLAFGSPASTMYWMENNVEGRISAFFKDRESWENIPRHWDGLERPSFDDYRRLDHGYVQRFAMGFLPTITSRPRSCPSANSSPCRVSNRLSFALLMKVL